LAITITRPAPARDAGLLRSRALLALLLGALATAVSAAGSWIPSLWGDEVTSVMSAQRPLPSLLTMLGHVDAVHGAYYAGLHVWGSVFGFSPFSVRFPSAIAVGFATAAVVLLADRLRSRRVAVLAGLVCAILPRVTYMGEEARSYAFSTAIVAWLTLLLIVALGRAKPARWWAAYGVLLAVGVYTFLYVALFVLVHAIVVLLARVPRRTLAGWAIATGAALAATTPVVVFAVLERGQVAYLGSTQQLAPQTVFSGLWFGDWPFAVVAWAAIVVAVVFEARRRVLVNQAVGGGALFSGGHRVPTLVFLGVLWLLLAPLVLIGMHSLVPDFTARYVSFCAPAAAMLVACGLDDLLGVRRWLGAVAGVLVVLLALPITVAQRTPYAKNQSDWAQMASVVAARATPGDAVVFDESTKPSRRPRLALHGYPAAFADVRDITLKTPYPQAVSWHDEAYSVPDAAAHGRFTGVDRVWLIEYAAAPGHVDTYGVAALRGLGFHATGVGVPTHRGLITLYTRTP
jgi:mannosyltransferase